MVRIEYQLTFEEFREGMLAVRKQIMQQAKRESRSRMWPKLAVWCGVVAMLTWLSMRNMNAAAQQPAAEPFNWRPHAYWVALFVLMFLFILYYSRKQFDRHVQGMWDGMPHLQQLQTVEFDD